MKDEPLARPLCDVVAALREEHVVPDLWRARVLREVGRASAPRRRWRRSVLAAAVLLVVLAGSAVLRTRGRDGSSLAPVATRPAHLARGDDTPVRFSVRAPGARRVVLIGDFDAWTPEGRPMRRSADGRTWELDVRLPPGRHAFAYRIDGVLRAEPGAARAVEDDFGVPSSVVVVASRGI